MQKIWCKAYYIRTRITHNTKSSEKYLIFSKSERPFGIQIFGNDPTTISEAAIILYENYKPNIIDINMGCPVKKVFKKGAGAALLKDIEKAYKICYKTAKNAPASVTVKARIGWDYKNIIAEEFIKAITSCIHEVTEGDFPKNKIALRQLQNEDCNVQKSNLFLYTF